MFLKLNELGSDSKLVYQLAEELKNDPQQVAMAQALTKDSSRPFGLKGTFGLFGSEEWWNNIKNGVMPTNFVKGAISRLFISGQDEDSQPNTFDLLLPNGKIHTESIFTDNNQDKNLFQIGRSVYILYVLDELKNQSSNFGDKANCSEIVVEMAVSLE